MCQSVIHIASPSQVNPLLKVGITVTLRQSWARTESDFGVIGTLFNQSLAVFFFFFLVNVFKDTDLVSWLLWKIAIRLSLEKAPDYLLSIHFLS